MMIRRLVWAIMLGLVLSPAMVEAKKRRKIRTNRMHLRHANTKKKTRNLRITERKGKRTVVRKRAQRYLEKNYLKDWRTGKVRRFPERLVWFLYLTAHHFDAEVTIISGYRHNERKTSRHKQAKAIDFRLKGVPTKKVWQYVKRFDNVGAGYYPTSNFVHLDSRDRSYYWIDDSGPGESSSYRKGVKQRKQKKKRRRRRGRAKRGKKKSKRVAKKSTKSTKRTAKK